MHRYSVAPAGSFALQKAHHQSQTQTHNLNQSGRGRRGARAGGVPTVPALWRMDDYELDPVRFKLLPKRTTAEGGGNAEADLAGAWADLGGPMVPLTHAVGVMLADCLPIV